jgi:hypothetical protein
MKSREIADVLLRRQEQAIYPRIIHAAPRAIESATVLFRRKFQGGDGA